MAESDNEHDLPDDDEFEKAVEQAVRRLRIQREAKRRHREEVRAQDTLGRYTP